MNAAAILIWKFLMYSGCKIGTHVYTFRNICHGLSVVIHATVDMGISVEIGMREKSKRELEKKAIL